MQRYEVVSVIKRQTKQRLSLRSQIAFKRKKIMRLTGGEPLGDIYGNNTARSALRACPPLRGSPLMKRCRLR